MVDFTFTVGLGGPVAEKHKLKKTEMHSCEEQMVVIFSSHITGNNIISLWFLWIASLISTEIWILSHKVIKSTKITRLLSM